MRRHVLAAEMTERLAGVRAGLTSLDASESPPLPTTPGDRTALTAAGAGFAVGGTAAPLRVSTDRGCVGATGADRTVAAETFEEPLAGGDFTDCDGEGLPRSGEDLAPPPPVPVPVPALVPVPSAPGDDNDDDVADGDFAAAGADRPANGDDLDTTASGEVGVAVVDGTLGRAAAGGGCRASCAPPDGATAVTVGLDPAANAALNVEVVAGSAIVVAADGGDSGRVDSGSGPGVGSGAATTIGASTMNAGKSSGDANTSGWWCFTGGRGAGAAGASTTALPVSGCSSR